MQANLCVQQQTWEVGSRQNWDILGLTLKYRLKQAEPGLAAELQSLLKRVSQRYWPAREVPEALAQLTKLEEWLRALPISEVISDEARLAAFSPSRQEMNALQRIRVDELVVRRAAPNAYEYFLTKTGEPMLAVLRKVLQEAARLQTNVDGYVSHLSRREKLIFGGLTLFIFALSIATFFMNRSDALQKQHYNVKIAIVSPLLFAFALLFAPVLLLRRRWSRTVAWALMGLLAVGLIVAHFLYLERWLQQP